jgi:hypothetical protein
VVSTVLTESGGITTVAGGGRDGLARPAAGAGAPRPELVVSSSSTVAGGAVLGRVPARGGTDGASIGR